jgi:hypothetical protein
MRKDVYAVFLTYFPYFGKIKGGLCDHLAVCVCPLNFCYDACEVTLLCASLCLCVPLIVFVFRAVRVVSQ